MRRLLALLILLAAPAWAATYYVDNCDVTGNDGNNGTSTSTPWLTINKVNTSSFSAGDSILFRAGCTWREQLTVPSSGSAGNPITFGAHGTGDKPLLLGSDDITAEAWTQATSGADVEAYITVDLADAGDDTASTAWNVSYYANIGGRGQPPSYILGLNFTDLAVPKDATISAAALTLTSSGNDSGTTVNVKIQAEAADDPAAFVDQADFQTRRANLGTESVNWSGLPGWTTDTEYASPDISAIIQEVVERAGWVSGNNITLFVFDNGSTAYTVRKPKTRDATHTTGLAVLSVTYADAIANVYYTTALSTDPRIVWLDGVTYPEAASAAAVNSTNRWYWDGGTNRLYIYAASNPNGFYSLIEAPTRDFCIFNENRDYITIADLECTYAILAPIFIGGTADYNTVQRVTVNGSGQWAGIWFSGTTTGHVMEDCEVWGKHMAAVATVRVGYTDQYTAYTTLRRNTVRNSFHTALGLLDADHCTVEYNYVKNDAEPTKWGRCFELDSKVGKGFNVVRYNWFEGAYQNDGSSGGNELQGEGNELYGNVICVGNEKGFGIHPGDVEGCLSVAIDQKVYNNVIYGFAGPGILLEDHGRRSPAGNIFKNNIITGCDPTDHDAVEYQADATLAAYQFINNSIYDAATTSTVYDGGASRTVAYMETNHATEWADNIIDDPLMTDPGSGDFTLQTGSPCIEKGANVGTTYLEQLLAGSSWPDSVETADWHKTGGAPDVGAYGYRKLIW